MQSSIPQETVWLYGTSTSMSFCSMAMRCSLVAFLMPCFAASTRATVVRSVLVVDAKDPVPPSEGSRKVVGERYVVEIMVLSTRPELRILCNDQGKSEDYLNTQ
jgi:hypothetical protein